MNDMESKIITIKDAAQVAKLLKGKGKIIGFTNGCFDLLHLGHLHSFKEAHKYCDVLFVGVNDDASVRALKGELRPIHTTEYRIKMLSGLMYVDYIIVFSELTAIKLVEQIRPDVIAKEGYTLDQWIEARYVLSYGGRVIELPRIDGVSSSSILKKIQTLSLETS